MKKREKRASPFDTQESFGFVKNPKARDEIDLAVAEYEQNLGMSIEEYKKWMIEKINASLRKIESDGNF